MCHCTPSIRTPFCGAPGCRWPEEKPGAARLYLENPSVQAEVERQRAEREIGIDDWYACYHGYHKCQRVSGEVVVAFSEERHPATLCTKIKDPVFIAFLEEGVK